MLRDQFPELAGLPIRRVAESGTDHDLYRVGDDLLARLPIMPWSDDQAARDQRSMRLLAPHLPLQIPEVFAIGRPGECYPWPWSLVSWVSGEAATDDNLDLHGAAVDLGAFVVAMQRIPTAGGQVKTGTSRGAAWSTTTPTSVCGSRSSLVNSMHPP